MASNHMMPNRISGTTGVTAVSAAPRATMTSGATAAAGATTTSRPTVTLCGGFSPINGMEFLGQSEAKGAALHKCQRIFNVREVQTRAPGENYVITARIIKSTSVNETWTLRFDIDPETRRVIKAWCSCYVGSTGKCKHSGALFKHVNSERPEGKTDREQQWTTPSRKAQERFPKGETVQQMFGVEATSVSKVVIQEDQPDFCKTLKEDLERFGLTNSSLFKSLSVDPVSVEEDIELLVLPGDLNIKIREIFHVGGMLQPAHNSPKLGPNESAFYKNFIETSDKEREIIFCSTIGGATGQNKKKWFDEREYRLSASTIRRIASAQTDETLHKYFKGSKIENANVRYGRDTEATALEAYKAMREEAGDVITVYESGLVICRHYSWICGTPDGLVVEESGQLTILEIKCPISGASGDINVKYLKGDNDELNLKDTQGRLYYTQVQVQLMACDAKKAHFFIYARPDENGRRRSKMLTIYRDDLYI